VDSDRPQRRGGPDAPPPGNPDGAAPDGSRRGAPPQPQAAKSEDGSETVAVTFIGGYDTDPRDHGRPVVLIAAALNVTPDVFRDAFSGVKPAAAGQEPDPTQVRLNKAALMRALTPHGITNERLDAVSNYYRYSGSRGQMWRNTPATAYATIKNGVITAVTITNAGAGYSSPPKVTIVGMPNVTVVAKLAFDADFSRNGSIKEIAVQP
jgi:hypothetical protein